MSCGQMKHSKSEMVWEEEQNQYVLEENHVILTMWLS